MLSLVLSLFPGIGLLDRAFEAEGFCVVRAGLPANADRLGMSFMRAVQRDHVARAVALYGAIKDSALQQMARPGAA